MSVAPVLEPNPQVDEELQLLNDDRSRQLELGRHPVDPLARFIYHNRLHTAPVIVLPAPACLTDLLPPGVPTSDRLDDPENGPRSSAGQGPNDP